MKPEDLITYCGCYGGSCARWCGYTEFRHSARILAEWVDAMGCQYWMPTEVKEFDFTEFRKALDFFGGEDTWFVCRKCCRGGDSYPECPVRKCCVERGILLCFECDEFPCEKTQSLGGLVGRAEEYRELGREEWLRRQVEEAEQGFELHTKKYYHHQVKG